MVAAGSLETTAGADPTTAPGPTASSAGQAAERSGGVPDDQGGGEEKAPRPVGAFAQFVEEQSGRGAGTLLDRLTYGS